MEYVVGFAFDQKDRTRVILIHKTKPAWQAGLWNGVGGKIEFGETPIEAMVREFEEETSIATTQADWTRFRLELFKEAGLNFFVAELPDSKFYSYKTTTEESVQAWNKNRLPKVIPNLTYLVPMAAYWLNNRHNLPIDGRFN